MYNNINIDLFSYFIFVLAHLSLLVGAFVFLKDKKAFTNLGFFLFSLCIYIWLCAYSFGYRLLDENKAMQWYKIGSVGVIFIVVTAYHFIIGFIKKQKTEKIAIFFSYFIGFCFTISLVKTGVFYDGLYRYSWGNYPKAGMIHPFYMLFLFGLVSRFLYLFTRYFFSVRQRKYSLEYQRVKYILLSFVMFTFAATDFMQNYGFPLFPVGTIFVVIYLLIVAYTIVRYRLLDISVAITRTGIFVAVYSLVLGVPFAIAFASHRNLINVFGDFWWVVPLLVSTVSAAAGPFVYLYFQKRAEDRIYSEQREYQETLRKASLGMGRIKDLDRLLNLIVHIVTRAVRLMNCKVYLYDTDKEQYVLKAAKEPVPQSEGEKSFSLSSPLIKHLLKEKQPVIYEELKQQVQDFNQSDLTKIAESFENLNAAVILPSLIEDRLIGFFVLGEKKNLKLYNQDDLAVFSILSNHAALAIENAQFYEDMRKKHEQLINTEKMATIGTMADGLSHQINNRFHAVSFITGDALDTIQMEANHFEEADKSMFDDLKISLKKIEDNVRQGAEVVEGLLKYTRKSELEFDNVDLQKILDAAIQMVKYKSDIRSLGLEFAIDGKLPVIHGSYAQLQEAFFNIIENAVDAIREKKELNQDPEYKGSITVNLDYSPGQVIIVFKDNGIGVKDENQNKIFTPFYTTKLFGKKGTGLGMYIIHQIIVDNHKGRVEFHSKYGEGSTMRIVFPLQ